MTYVELPITTDQATLQNDAFEYVQGKVDGYQLDPAHPMTWLIESIGRMMGVALFQASLMPSANLRTLGETVYSIPRGDGTPAVASTTWTARDTLGHTIRAGAPVLIDGVPFTVDLAVTIPEGSSSSGAGAVSVTAMDVGTAGNDLGQTVEPVDADRWIESIAVLGSTSGGTEAETDQAVQNRITALLSMQAPRAITARDFETFSVYTLNGPRTGVGRATVLDNYDADTSTAGVEGHVTIVLQAPDGGPVTAGVKAAVLADLGAKRIANIVVHVVDPWYEDITIGYGVTAYESFDKPALRDQIDAALSDYFDRTRWGAPPFGQALPPFNTAVRWVNTDTVNYLQVAKVIQNVEGVRTLDDLTINSAPSDWAMTGAVPLPQLQPITTHDVT